MTLHELWRVSPQSFIFIRNADGSVEEYHGHPLATDKLASSKVANVFATSYPMFKSVLEVRLA